MATNYFENLGFGANQRQGLNDLAQVMYAKKAEQEKQAMQAKQEQAAQIKFANDQQKQRAAQGAMAFNNALMSGNDQAALQVAQQYAPDINSLGDPSFTVDTIAEMIKTPQGKEQLKQMSVGMVQMAAGPEAYAKYSQELIKPKEQQTYDQPASIKELEYYQKLQQTNPEAAAKFARSRGYVDTPKEQSLTPQERNIATYRKMVESGDKNAESFGRAAGLISSEGQKLSATAERELLDSANQAELNAVNVTKYLDLAERFKNSDIQGGIFGTGGTVREALKAAFGNQDEEVSKTLSDWQKIRSGEAIASLPQGPATDADIKLALKPFPENANAEYMDSYLRGLAKIAAYKAEYSKAKSDFITENGSIRGKGTNFSKEWEKRRGAVLEQVGNDPRFMQSKVNNFVGRQATQTQPQAPAQQGGVQLSINENPATTNAQEEFKIIEVKQ